MELEFTGDIWQWRGPSPFYFLSVPDESCAEVRDAAESVSYGWGMGAVRAQIGGTEWKTSLFPPDGSHAVPLKASVSARERADDGDTVSLRLGFNGVD